MALNPYFMSESDVTPTNQIRDDLDFPHSGIFKTLHLATKGTYIIKETVTDFNIAQTSPSTFTVLTIQGGAGFRHGKYVQIGSGSGTATTITMNTAYNPGTGAVDITPHATLDVYLLLVAKADNTIVLRGANTSQNSVPEYVDGDILIAVIKLVGGSADGLTNRPIQYLTTNQDDNSLSIGYASSDNYIEALSVSSDTAGEVTIENKVSNKDIIFKVNDGGSAGQEVFRIDAIDQRIGINQASPLSTLDINGSISNSLTVASGATLTLDETHSYVMLTYAVGTIAVTMPPVEAGRTYTLAHFGSAPATLDGHLSETFTTVAGTGLTLNIGPSEWVTLVGGSGTWYLMQKGGLM